MKNIAHTRLFFICMLLLFCGCQTISQNFPSALHSAGIVHHHAVNTFEDSDTFCFADDFFLHSQYLPERRLCSIPPDERVAAMMVQLREQNNYTAKLPAFPLVRNTHVDRYITYYRDTAHRGFAASLEKSAAYLPYITSVFEKENIPKELAYLALIESDFNVRAYSRKNAAGMWQFTKKTAQGCGLRVNRWVDERLDFEKSTQAAACYLKKLYAEFGSWHLVVAAYNAGEMRIKNALCEKGTRNFWAIHNSQHLTCETVNFVPQLIAVITIAKNPRAYGFSTLQYEEPFAYDTVTISQPVALNRVARYCGSSLGVIKDLNPALKKDSTPPDCPAFQIHIPRGTKQQFLLARAEHSPSAHPAVAYHIVRKGETLYHLAQKYGTSAQALRTANGIKNPKNIKAGETLVIARARHDASYCAPIRSHATKDRSFIKTAAQGRAVYRVKSGDTLWRIARSFNLHPEHLKRWNNLTQATLHPGTELKIYSQQRK